MSELQIDSDVWAAIVGKLENAPHRARTGLTMRAKLIAVDAKGNAVRVRLVIRRGQAFDQMADLQPGDRVRLVGKLAVPDEGDSEFRAALWMDVDSAVRLGAERIEHPSRIGRLIKRLFKTT
ncbi:hypothetical protein PP715_22455 [Ralstonia solanacearum]|uniref:Uncharacterized protein n=2 Tax=Ralstonia solanacearum TaxID=305 RepID=A0A5H2PL70_RALSL|nr:hypothetical protein [Ralstonia solanacearum]AEG68586.1 conserved hypothetical protein [Ralstonia solanacearum Po82]AMP69844.1 hypothetical protein UW163_10325 [Ralstonia solanacearum]AYB60228.1 hypothetical protein C2124_06255 [Ralstonia solanacearum]MBB6587036.1 hypothetical protein [Ralstonia solanacearum]MCG3577597.1 DUF4131 domain-containing protein [Ralstonia solanacearum]